MITCTQQEPIDKLAIRARNIDRFILNNKFICFCRAILIVEATFVTNDIMNAFWAQFSFLLGMLKNEIRSMLLKWSIAEHTIHLPCSILYIPEQRNWNNRLYQQLIVWIIEQKHRLLALYGFSLYSYMPKNESQVKYKIIRIRNMNNIWKRCRLNQKSKPSEWSFHFFSHFLRLSQSWIRDSSILPLHKSSK